MVGAGTVRIIGLADELRAGEIWATPMSHDSLAERVRVATGLPAGERVDPDALAGFFNRFRPDGAGLGAILEDTGVEGQVRRRLQNVFEATAPAANDGDCYFIVRRPAPIDRAGAVRLAQSYLADFGAFVARTGDDGLSTALRDVRFVQQPPADGVLDEDLSVRMYECLTDFLAELEHDDRGVFLLKEAIYTMACDYFLTAYVLWPAIELHPDGDVFERYFELWRSGIQITLYEGGLALIEVPAV